MKQTCNQLDVLLPSVEMCTGSSTIWWNCLRLGEDRQIPIICLWETTLIVDITLLRLSHCWFVWR